MSITDGFWKRIFIGKNHFYNEKNHTYDYVSHVPLAYPLIGLLASLARNTHYSIASKIITGVFLAIAAVITTPITFVFFGCIALLGTLITGPIDLFSPSSTAEASIAADYPQDGSHHNYYPSNPEYFSSPPPSYDEFMTNRQIQSTTSFTHYPPGGFYYSNITLFTNNPYSPPPSYNELMTNRQQQTGTFYNH